MCVLWIVVSPFVFFRLTIFCLERLQLRVCMLKQTNRPFLGMQYATNLKAYRSNPVYDCVFNSLYEHVYDKQHNTIQPFGLRVQSHFENSDIHLDDIAPIVIPENPP